MQVDLFKNQELYARACRQSQQIATRQFKIASEFSDFNELNAYYVDPKELERQKVKLNELVEQGRQYSYIGSAGCDNMFPLEAMNLAHNSKSYASILDFSNCLDFALMYSYGCKLEDIRKIDDYEKISKAILNYDFEQVGNVCFSSLIEASDELQKAFVELSNRAKAQDMYYNDRLPWMIYRFYDKILSDLSLVKFYVMVVICNHLEKTVGRKGVIRSMNFSSVMATTDDLVNEKIFISYEKLGIKDYPVPIRTYRPFEYVGEVLRQDVTYRKVFNQRNGDVLVS